MSIEITCDNCGEEYDSRHEGCPGCTISIACEGGITQRVRVTRRFGDWAVHHGPAKVSFSRNDVRLAWTITHVPTGMRASCSETVGMTKVEALKIARHLSRHKFKTRAPSENFGRDVYEQILAALGLGHSDPTP